jgi:uncharacterized protein YndB with AHSA1/START domain
MSKLDVSTDIPNEIHFTRTFDAPRHLVRRAFFEPELIKRWMGGVRSTVTSSEADLRVGGRYRNAFRTPDGYEFAFVGTFHELGDDRVVNTEAMEGQPGESRVTTTFTEKDGKTHVHIVMAFENQQIRDYVVGTGMAEGAGESYDHLDVLLREL